MKTMTFQLAHIKLAQVMLSRARVRFADLAHLGHDIAILLLGFGSWTEGSFQDCARVQVQGPEAHLLLSELLFNHLSLMQQKLTQEKCRNHSLNGLLTANLTESRVKSLL